MPLMVAVIYWCSQSFSETQRVELLVSAQGNPAQIAGALAERVSGLLAYAMHP